MKRIHLFLFGFLLAGICFVTAQENTKTTAINPNKFIFGINVNLGGLIPSSSGNSINFEFGKGNFNSEINIIFPSLWGYYGGIATFNYFWHSKIGGGYLGGGIALSLANIPNYSLLGLNPLDWFRYSNQKGIYFPSPFFASIAFGINGGYKFVMESGLYFRTGAFIGFDFMRGSLTELLYIKPDFAIGWTMR